MLRFLVRRTGQGALVLWLISMVVFALFFVVPNNVARTLAGRQATAQTVALIERRLGLDLPLWQQYVGFVGRALRGDLGYDYYHQVPVTTIIGQALPVTLSLVIGAAILWLVLGIFNGVVSAVRARSFLDRSLTAWRQLETPDDHAAQQVRTFLALLEMIRLKLVRVFQSGNFGPIRVYKRPRPADAPHPIGDPEAHRG